MFIRVQYRWNRLMGIGKEEGSSAVVGSDPSAPSGLSTTSTGPSKTRTPRTPIRPSSSTRPTAAVPSSAVKPMAGNKVQEGDGHRVCGRLTNGLHAARQGLELELSQGTGQEPAKGPGSGLVSVGNRAAMVAQSLRYLKEAFSALCKLGAGTPAFHLPSLTPFSSLSFPPTQNSLLPSNTKLTPIDYARFLSSSSPRVVHDASNPPTRSGGSGGGHTQVDHAPRQEPGLASRQGSHIAPGQGSGLAPGQGPVSAPRQGPDIAPGHGPGQSLSYSRDLRHARSIGRW